MAEVSKHTYSAGDAAQPATRPLWVDYLETNAVLSWVEGEDDCEIQITEAGRAALDRSERSLDAAQQEDREFDELIEQLNFWGQ